MRTCLVGHLFEHNMVFFVLMQPLYTYEYLLLSMAMYPRYEITRGRRQNEHNHRYYVPILPTPRLFIPNYEDFEPNFIPANGIGFKNVWLSDVQIW